MQDEIVTHLARALAVELPEVEAARLKRTPAANPDAEDLALQCWAIAEKDRYIGKEAEAGYRLCEQALAADPNNVRALTSWRSSSSCRSRSAAAPTQRPISSGRTNWRRERSPSIQIYRGAHGVKANILYAQERLDEGIAESRRALELDPVRGVRL